MNPLPSGNRRLALPKAALLGALCVALAACEEGMRTITKTRIVTAPSSGAPRSMSSSDRFGLSKPKARSQPRPSARPPRFDYEAPASWTKLPLTQYRIINLNVDGNKDVECWVTVLPGSGGGLRANINRWRVEQFALAALKSGELESLPRHKLEKLGSEAVLVDIEGPYRGMGAAEKKPDYRMLGAIFTYRDYSAFVRLVGPTGIVSKKQQEFVAFLDSLTESEASGGPEKPPIAWDVPEGWREGPAKSMRLVTLLPGADDKTQCYMSLAGGTPFDNANRWVGQLGQPKLDQAAFDKLELVDVARRKGHVVEVSGDFKGGMGSAPIPNAMLLGIILPVDATRSLFIKMIGPESVVRANRDKFFLFAKSLRPNQ